MQWFGVAFSRAVLSSEQKTTWHVPVAAPGKCRMKVCGLVYSLLPAQVENE